MTTLSPSLPNPSLLFIVRVLRNVDVEARECGSYHRGLALRRHVLKCTGINQPKFAVQSWIVGRITKDILASSRPKLASSDNMFATLRRIQLMLWLETGTATALSLCQGVKYWRSREPFAYSEALLAGKRETGKRRWTGFEKGKKWRDSRQFYKASDVRQEGWSVLKVG